MVDREDLARSAPALFRRRRKGARNLGGRRLLKKAITFCDEHSSPAIEHWAFAGLDAVRHLYEMFGFKLVEK